MGVGFVLLLCVLAFLVGDAINDAGSQTLSASIQKILLNYLQVVTLFNAFPLRWPAELEFLFEAQGAISTVGEHLVNPDCIATSSSAAELYYSKQQFFAAMPFIVAVISFGIWYVYGRIKQKSFFAKRGDRKDTTTKDKFVVTVTTVLYLLYPTLCKNTFGLFDCKTIGAQAYLKIDLEEPCYQGRHQTMMLLLGVGQLIVYVVGLPLVVLVFLRRNRASLTTHVSQARYGLFYGGYKTDRFFWETVITGRKVSVVMLSVFGPELGPEKQAQVALLLILICIVFEIHGDPYLMKTPKHQILGRLELSALMIEWGTMWSGLMIFQLDESKPSDKGFAITLTIAVIVTNTFLLVCFVVQFIRAKLHERKEAARLAALKPKQKKNKSFLSASFSALRQRFGSIGAEVGGEVELTGFENPMQEKGVKNEIKEKKRNSRMKKVRKKLSIGARVKRKSHAGRGGLMGRKAKTVLDVEDAVSVHVDEETGHRYSYDAVAGQTKWLEEGDEEDGTALEEQGETKQRNKKSLFRQLLSDKDEVYYENVETGDVVWVIPKDGDLLESCKIK
jgi:hypothetical protein